MGGGACFPSSLGSFHRAPSLPRMTSQTKASPFLKKRKKKKDLEAGKQPTWASPIRVHAGLGPPSWLLLLAQGSVPSAYSHVQPYSKPFKVECTSVLHLPPGVVQECSGQSNSGFQTHFCCGQNTSHEIYPP